MTKTIAIVGRSGSGKTTLIEKLIRELCDRGFKVGTVKHSHHDCEMDQQGKDSWRHKRAGAERSILVSKEKMMIVANRETLPDPEELTGLYFNDLDLAIVEGFKTGNCPKIEVVRAERSKEVLSSKEEGLKAVVTDLDLEVDLPVFSLEEVEPLTDFIVENFIEKKSK